METRRSIELFEEASALIPGGVNSPVRAFKGVGGTPPFIARAKGAYLWDADGNRYLDAVGSWGPMILGHARDEIVEAVQHAAAGGTSFGAPTEGEVRLAETVLARVPQFDRIRFVNSGTEATMSALRVARAVTKRPLVLKFAGNYHGHSDGLLVDAGSGLLTTGQPSSAGVPGQVADLTLVAPYNNPVALRELLLARGEDLAAIIFEPVVGNMGVVEPLPEFLDVLQEARSEHGVLLVADEVMSGFRVARGGALERYGIAADLAAYGKIIGGGLPVGAYAGTAQVMDYVSPVGPVYQAGTLSGNPLAMAAGQATFEAMDAVADLYGQLEGIGARVESILAHAAERHAVRVVINRVGSMITVFFTQKPVVDLASASATDTAAFSRWFHGLLSQGVYWPASNFEAAFLSTEIGDEEFELLADAADFAFAQVA